MSDALELKLEGLEDLGQTFRDLEEAISAKKASRELTGLLIVSLKGFVAQARARAHQLSASTPLWRRRQWPTSPVHVAEAIRVQWTRGDSGEVAATAGVPRSHFWGVFLEYGTRVARAFPFLRPGWDPGQVLDSVASGLRSRLERVRTRRTR